MIDVEEATALVYNRIHQGGYARTWDTANDKTKWRAAIAELLTAVDARR